MRVTNGCRRPGFTSEPLQSSRLFERGIRNLLDRYVASQRRDERFINNAHPAATDSFDNFVLPDLFR